MKRLALKFGGTSVGTIEKIKKVAESIPNCEVIYLSPAGHAMFSEHPNAVLDGLIKIV